jgi:nitrile hydratase
VDTNLKLAVIKGPSEEPIFQAGDRVIISSRFPVGHYRVPRYIRGKHCVIEGVIEPCGVNNEEEGFGRNAGQKRHYYRVAIPLSEVWPGYMGPGSDGLRIEIFENWLQKG